MEKLASHVLGLLSRYADEHGFEFPSDLPALPRVPNAYADKCLRKLAEQRTDSAFTLEIAPHWHPSDFGALGYAWLASPTLRSALGRLVRFKRVVGERPTVAVREADGGVWVVYDHRRDDDDMDHWGSELLIALFVTMCRFNYGGRFAPLRVRLRSPAPEDDAPYSRFFGCPVEFGGTENAFLVGLDVVDASLPTGNPEVVYALDALLTTQLAAIDKDDLISRCRLAIHRLLPSGAVSARELAASVCVSERSLQRKLAAQGTTFQALVDEVRKETAYRFLADLRFSVTEIAFLCGFSNSSAFARAFLRWTGTSPTEWRDSQSPKRGGAQESGAGSGQ